MTMRRPLAQVVLLISALAIMLSLAPGRATAAGYTVVMNNRTVSDAMAEMREGQLMVSVRPYIEAMGGTVTWSQADYRATVNLNGSQLAMWIGNNMSYHDGQRIWAPVKPFIRNGRTMVPAWWLAVQLKANVGFASNRLTVTTRGGSASAVSSNPLANPNYFFPYPAGSGYETYYDGMGDPRYYDGKSFGHEGTDILAPRGTPIVAVASGTVVRYGWNTLGGYRVTVELDDLPGYKFYYAHMDRYASGIYLGAHVRAGQVLGYTGSTGEGPERTQGKFVNHLHFGIYKPDWTAMNPYPLLKFWENHKIRL